MRAAFAYALLVASVASAHGQDVVQAAFGAAVCGQDACDLRQVSCDGHDGATTCRALDHRHGDAPVVARGAGAAAFAEDWSAPPQPMWSLRCGSGHCLSIVNEGDDVLFDLAVFTAPGRHGVQRVLVAVHCQAELCHVAGPRGGDAIDPALATELHRRTAADGAIVSCERDSGMMSFLSCKLAPVASPPRALWTALANGAVGGLSITDIRQVAGFHIARVKNTNGPSFQLAVTDADTWTFSPDADDAAVARGLAGPPAGAQVSFEDRASYCLHELHVCIEF